MNSIYRLRIILVFMVLCLIISGLPPFTPGANAEDADDKTSMEIAAGWGFDTSRPEKSLERETLGENPMGAGTSTVSTFGDVPLEIAVLGGRINIPYLAADRGNIYYYDNYLPGTDTFTNTGVHENVRDITWSAEKDVRPATTAAADMDGDGIDEIVRYFIDVNYNGEDPSKYDGDIKSFNDGVTGYSADFRLHCINTQTGTNIARHKIRTVSRTDQTMFFIPDSTYYWSSYMQMTAGDYDGDGKEEIAVMAPGSDIHSGHLFIYGMESGRFAEKYSQEVNYYSYGIKDNYFGTAFHLASGDADNDKIDELIFTQTINVTSVDDCSYICIIDYKDGAYTPVSYKPIKFGNKQNDSPVGNAGATVGDIDNDGLNEVVVGGYMVNKDNKDATYTFTGEDGTTVEFEYYRELAMSYLKYDKDTKAYGNFQGFTVLRNEEEMAWTAAFNNETRYNDNPSPKLSSGARYRNGQNWTVPIQSVSLTGYVNGKNNHQIFFGNCIYYYDSGCEQFNVYDDSGKVDGSMVVYDDFFAPASAINTLVSGNFMTGSRGYEPTEGREQLLVVSSRLSSGKNIFMITLMYESAAGTPMDVNKMSYFLGASPSGDVDQRDYYPTVCAPNMDNDAVFVQYLDYEFTYSKPEVLAVLASLPYYEDIYNAYPMWEPGSTYLSKSSGSSQTDTGFAEFSLGWYLSFEQDIGIFGIKFASFEMETSIAISTSQEFSHTVERESSVTYETSGGQDSVVMVSSPLDMYYYRYYEESDAYAAAYPTAVRSDPSTWGIMAVSLPSAPQTLVFPVDNYNELAERYNMEVIDSDFWMHTSGDPGTYPKNAGQFKNAGNVLSSDSSISATSGSGSVTTELTITESMEYAYTVSLTSEARVGAGVAGAVMGVSFENTLGFGGATVNFRGTTIGASLCNFPSDGYDTGGFSLTTRLHSYTTEFNRKDIMVLYYTVSQVMGLPKLPSSFYMSGRTADNITLAWEVPEIISDALRPASYELYRYDSYYDKWYPLEKGMEVVPGTKQYYLDTDVYPGEIYKYRLVAKDNTGAKTNSVTLEASTLPTGEPPVILSQPRDFTAGAGYGATFSVDARLPENVAPTRLYYQWYQRKNVSDVWTAISDANEKTLALAGVTPDMDGCQYCCQVSLLINNTFPLSAHSAYAKLTVTTPPPEMYAVNYAAGINGSVAALEAGAGGNYEISSGSRMFAGTKVVFTAEPAMGCRVNQWSINGTPVEGNTGNTLAIDSLSGEINVHVSFTYSTYNITFDIAENLDENQGDAVWGAISAVYAGTYVLPRGEATSVAAQAPVTFTAVPETEGGIKYTVKHWKRNGEIVKNNDGSVFIGKTYLLEALTEDTVVEVMFAKAVEYTLEVSSEIVNTDVAYFNNGSITVRENGAVVSPGDPIEKGLTVTIEVAPPDSALIYSWEITPVDEAGIATGAATVLGSQSSYTFAGLSSSYRLKITYVIISTKTVVFGSEGGSGTVEAIAGVGNTEASGVLTSGGKVQMYADIVFTAYPEDDALGVKGWTVNGIYQTNTATDYILEDINKNTTVKTLFETAPAARTQISAIEIKAGETAEIAADTVASDDDRDSLTVSGISTPPVAGTANAGVADGKAVITGVNEGTTSAVITVSDGKGHTCEVTVPIKVSNNLQEQPAGLEGIAPTSKDGSDGKITGLIAGKIYQYKAAASIEDYTTLAAGDGCSEITGLRAGTYLVRFAAIPGNNASKAIEVEVLQYVPKSVADLDALSFKVGGAEEKAVPDFNSNTVTYFVALHDDVENGTEIHLAGVPAAESRATVTETLCGTVQDGFATAEITVAAEDEVTSKTYTVYFATGETAGGDVKILEFKMPVDGITAVGAIDEAAKTISVTVPVGADLTNLQPVFILSAGAKAEIAGVEQVSGVSENDFSNPVVYTIKAEDSATQTAYTVNVAAAMEAITYYSLNVGVGGGCAGMGSVTGGGSYEENERVTITAIPEPDCTFTVWEVVYGDFAAIDLYADSTTFNMPAIDGLTINAVFAGRETPDVIPAAACFDKYDSNANDKLNRDIVSFAVHSGDYEFTGIAGMTLNTDYLAEDGGNTVTITNSTLHSLEKGLHNLAFVFTGGKRCIVALEIENSRPVVTCVLVNPASATVTQGRTKTFTAEISGINHGNAVEWSVTGNTSENTYISAGGVLVVDVDEEPGTELTVKAVSTVDPGRFGTAKVIVVGKVDAATPVFEVDLTTDTVVYNVGESAAALSVRAAVTDGGTVSYQWYENTENSTTGGAIIDGANSASYTPSTETAGTKYYYVVAANENPDATGSTTATSTGEIKPVQVNNLVHAAAPVITGLTGRTSYLQGEAISEDDTLKVSATSTDDGELSFQWYLKAPEAVGQDALVSSEDCCIPETSVAGTFTYYAVVTNHKTEGITGNTTATVTSGHIVVTVAAVVNAAQPAFTEGGNLSGAVNYPVGGQASPLKVTATAADLGSGGVLSYQWYVNTLETTEGGTPLAGANSAGYTPDISGWEAGTKQYYYVIVTNTNEGVNGAKTASITSGIKAVNVQEKVDAAAPVIEEQSAGSWTYYQGAAANCLEVYATADDGGIVSYQWYHNSVNNNTNGEALEGATGRIYRPSTETTGTTYYYVVVTNTNTKVNGNQTAAANGEVSAIHVVQPVLEGLGKVGTAITGVAYGTQASASALGLPEIIPIEISIDGASFSDTATVSWDLSGYNTSKTAAQTFAATGTVILPTGVLNVKGISLRITVNVSVDAKPSSGGGGGGSPAPKPATETSKKINATTGGKVSFGGVSVDIPAGALPGDATISIEKLTPSEANKTVPEGLRLKLGSDIYEITTTGARDFGDNNITIRIPFDLGKITAGEAAAINYYDEKTGKWTALATTVERGPDGQWYAVVAVNHLTRFAVFSTAVPVQPPKVIKLTIGLTEAAIDGKPYTLDAAPFIKLQVSRTLVPLRFVSEALGARVDWRAAARQVVIQDGATGIILTIDSPEVLVNSAPVTLDCPAELHPPGRTFVPLRFVSETLGARVDWDAATKTITITR